ncbi:MAG: PEP-CTERM sorting domain-containing protein [Betaproteobacteria bacterium]|jgi:hypothetical protein
MKFQRFLVATVLACAAGAANAASTTFFFDYMATNLKGDFATASGGSAVPVARLDLEDLAGGTGVRASFQVLPNGLTQFASGTGGQIYISAFLLNFPGTDMTSGYSHVDVSGVPLSGGVEWEENGATNGWGAVTGDPSFEQEYNWGSTLTMNQSSGSSVVDILNAPGASNISVASLLGNPVENTNPTLPDAYAWIKVRSFNQGIAQNADNWWGLPAANAAGGRLNVLSVAAVPEPSEYAMLAAGLGLVGAFVRGRRVSR